MTLTTEAMQEIYEAAVHVEATDDEQDSLFELLCKLEDVGGTGATIRKLIDMVRAANREAQPVEAQPVSQGCKLPDNVREALTLALQAMEFMGDTLNNIDAVCTEDVEYVTPAFNAIRGLLAAAPEGGNG